MAAVLRGQGDRNMTIVSPRILGSVLAVVCVSSVTPLAGEAQEARIEGTVTVGATPATDATVSLAGLGLRVPVDAQGRYVFEEVPPGTYVLEANSVRWGRGITTVRAVAGETVRADLALEPLFHLDELVVSAGAGAVRRSEAYQPASVVTSRELVRVGEATLGETLSREPGVNSTYFGPGASRPIIRGIGGDRVRILEGGIGVGDASSTSPDHAVGVESRTADRIEVIRGPATLLYGSSAVGGIVNVLDAKIAREPPLQSFGGYVEALGGSVADERTGSGSLTASARGLVVNASALWRETSDYSIPSPAEADHEGARPGADEEIEGILENSALETRRAALGLTWIGGRGYLGAAWSGLGSEYGVPGGHPEEEGAGAEEEPITIDLDQRRVDLEGALRFGSGAIRNVRVRLGVADYEHVELEGEEVGTRFFNDYHEARVESQHELNESVHGALGAQYASRAFEALGEEAFVPPTNTRSLALFGYEELAASATLRFQGGLRFERQTAESPSTGVSRTDDAISLSGGLNWDAVPVLTLAMSASRSVKLPNAEELFSNGPHAATQAFEIGNPRLDAETALGVDLTAHLHGERFRGSASLFNTLFDDYIHESATGELRDGLPVFEFIQGEARFRGFELEGEVDLIESDATGVRPHLSLELMTDFVSARLTDADVYLPRIPPLRVGGGLNYQQGGLVISAAVRRTMEQSRVAPLETESPGFTMVDASASYRLFTGELFHDIMLVTTNLTDEEARLHTSFLKEFAPLPGREIRLVYRINF